MTNELIWEKDGFYISTERTYLDRAAILRYLQEEAYWAKGMDRAVLQKSHDNSVLCFGVYEGDPRQPGNRQAGFARVVSDLARFAYLADVFILPAYRGLGLGKWLVERVVNHPELIGVKSIMLATSDAHGLYAQYGFKPLDAPEKYMVIRRPKLEAQSSR